jgi:hypothetical protein
VSIGDFPLSESQQVVHMLARSFYVHFAEIKGDTPRSAPYAPEWAYDYARIAHAYLRPDDEEAAIDLRLDYK